MSFTKFLNFLHWSFIRPVRLGIGPLAALGIGAAGSALGGLLGGRSQERAARIAADASRFAPVGISSGYGTTLFDKETGFSTELSPQYQALRNQLLAQGAAGLDAFQTFDPAEAGNLFASRLNEMAAPQEEQNRLRLENRLFQQGLTGSTGGANQAEALLSAQALAQQQRNLQGMQFGQQQQDRLFQQALGNIQAGSTIDNLQAQQLNQAIAAGGANTAANTTGANFQFQAAQNNADALSGFFGSLGQGFSNLAFQQPTVRTDYNASFPDLPGTVY